MANLRAMVDGNGSLELNLFSPVVDTNWKPQDDFVLRKKANRSGPMLNEVLVGKILAMKDNGTAEVGIQKQGGTVQRAIVNLKDIEPVTDKFRRSSIQFSPAYRPRV